MTACEVFQENTTGTVVDVAPHANGTNDVGELTPNVSGPSPRPLGVSRSIPRRKLSGSLAASLFLHISALAVLAHPSVRSWRMWELQLPSGSNSVALAASVASPQSEAAATVEIPKPQVEAVEEPLQRRESELPDTPAAQFASAPTDRRVPLPEDELRRSDVETPAPTQQPESARPKRTAVAKLTPRDTVITMESSASNPAAASSGAVREVPPRVVREVKALYPPAASAAGMQGVVMIYVRVSNRGEVTTALVHKSSGYPLLDQAALEAILQYQFASFDDDDGVAAEFLHPIRFSIVRD